jgi:hypothetical protein
MSNEMDRYSLSWDIFGGSESVTLNLTWKLNFKNEFENKVKEEHEYKMKNFLNSYNSKSKVLATKPKSNEGLNINSNVNYIQSGKNSEHMSPEKYSNSKLNNIDKRKNMQHYKLGNNVYKNSKILNDKDSQHFEKSYVKKNFNVLPAYKDYNQLNSKNRRNNSTENKFRNLSAESFTRNMTDDHFFSKASTERKKNNYFFDDSAINESKSDIDSCFQGHNFIRNENRDSLNRNHNLNKKGFLCQNFSSFNEERNNRKTPETHNNSQGYFYEIQKNDNEFFTKNDQLKNKRLANTKISDQFQISSSSKPIFNKKIASYLPKDSFVDDVYQLNRDKKILQGNFC